MNFQASSDLKRRVLTAIALPLVSNTISCNQEMDLAGYWSILEWQETLSGFSGSKRKSSCMAWMRRRSNKADNKTAEATIQSDAVSAEDNKKLRRKRSPQRRSSSPSPIKSSENINETAAETVQSDAVSAEDNKKLNKTETLNKLYEMVKASAAAAEGDEKKIQLGKLKEFIVDSKELFESEMSDEELDAMMGRVNSGTFKPQVSAAIMTSLSKDHRWFVGELRCLLHKIAYGDGITPLAEVRSAENLKAMVEIAKCNFTCADPGIMDISDECWILIDWAIPYKGETLDRVCDIVKFSQAHTFDFVKFMKENNPNRRLTERR